MGEVVQVHFDPKDRQVGALIRSWRLTCGASPAWTARAAGLSLEQLNDYEAGAERAPAAHLFRLALVLDVSPARLLPVLKSQWTS